jgi:hypothetical protein
LESGASKDYDGRVRRIPPGLKLAAAAFAVVYVPAYLGQYGPVAFLWFCNLGNLLLLAGLWLESALLVSMVALSVLLVQVLWSVDFLSRLLLDVHPIGGTGYMWKSEIPLWIRALSLFHLVGPALMVFALQRLGYERRALPAQTILAWIMLPLCYLFTNPGLDVNWVFGLFDRRQEWMSPLLYLFLTMAGYAVLLYLPGHLLLRRLFKAPPP